MVQCKLFVEEPLRLALRVVAATVFAMVDVNDLSKSHADLQHCHGGGCGMERMEQPGDFPFKAGHFFCSFRYTNDQICMNRKWNKRNIIVHTVNF